MPAAMKKLCNTVWTCPYPNIFQKCCWHQIQALKKRKWHAFWFLFPSYQFNNMVFERTNAAYQSYANALILCITLHCCLMFVSSWLVNPEQIQHQSSEALNCDIFCQSCENKGCIKCPATTLKWSVAQEGGWCGQNIGFRGNDCLFLPSFKLFGV